MQGNSICLSLATQCNGHTLDSQEKKKKSQKKKLILFCCLLGYLSFEEIHCKCMAILDEFFASPSVETLNKLTKDQLRQVGQHYCFDLGLPRTAKLAQLQAAVQAELIVRNILPSPFAVAMPESEDGAKSPSLLKEATCTLSFEQQKELIEMQQREREAEREAERQERDAQRREREAQREYELEKIKLEREVTLERLRLVGEGKLSADEVTASRGSARPPDISNMVKLIPKFNEKDPDVFFTLFENVAADRDWSDSEKTLLLQSVLVDKAQEAFVALPATDRKKYEKVKKAVLKAYELVPEAYRLKFRSWRKGDKQTYTEVARELSTHFNRWCSAVDVTTFEQLSNLIVLEQFRNILPERIATHVAERNLKTATEAASVADDFALIHKHSFREHNSGRRYRDDQRWGHGGQLAPPPSPPRSFDARTQNMDQNVNRSLSHKNAINSRLDSGHSVPTPPVSSRDIVCHYCLEKGHLKKDCPVLKGKSQRNIHDSVKSVNLAVSA